MRKFFRYLLLVLADSKKLSEALNKSKTSLELDSIVLMGGGKDET